MKHLILLAILTLIGLAVCAVVIPIIWIGDFIRMLDDLEQELRKEITYR